MILRYSNVTGKSDEVIFIGNKWRAGGCGITEILKLDHLGFGD